MLGHNYGDWAFWEAYNPPLYLGEQKVTFDGINKLVLVNHGVTEINFRVDVYSGWKEWVKDPNHNNAKFAEALVAIGGDPLPGDRQLGTSYFFENDWRMRTWEGAHRLEITGNVFTREGEDVFVNTLEKHQTQLVFNVSTLVEAIIPTLSLGQVDIDAVATATWAEVLSGTDAGTRLVNLATVLAALNDTTAQEIWEYIIDTARNQSAEDKLSKIATKIQDIALD